MRGIIDSLDTWDLARGLPVVLDDGTNTYVYGLDLIAAIDGSDVATFLYDGLGSTTELLDEAGDATDAYTYDVFGAVRASTGSSANPWLFTGEQHDADSDLYYLRARYYDSATGRFLSQDPIGIGNRYSYVGNNPVNYVDPYGLFGWKDIKNAASDAAGAVGGYVGDKAQDLAGAVGQCVANPVPGTCATQAATFALSLTCTGDRHAGPGGWVYYTDVKGGCEWMWLVANPSCYTPGYITFCDIKNPSSALICHEYQHYVQSLVIPAPFYWIIAADWPGSPGEADAAKAGKEGKAFMPFTDIAWPIQCP